jgi:glycosyltransferase involved in cell wall biosynthesis
MGGIGSYVRQCAAALALAGHEPHVFTLSESPSQPQNIPPGVVLHQTPDPAARVLAGTLSAELSAALNAGGEAIYRLGIAWLLTDAFQREHQQNAFDIVEVADVDASGLPLLLDAGRSLPVIVHLHTCTAIANRINNAEIGSREKLIEAMEAAQIHLADAICAPTRAVVNSTRAFTNIDREPEIIPHPYVCPESVSAPHIPPPANGPILFIGRLEWRKGCGVIAEILNDFLRANPAAKIRFIGPDTSTAPGGNSVRLHLQQSLENDLRDRVEFTGELPLPEVEKSLLGCSFCLLPSLSENFSLAICEAMAAGRITIVAAGTGSVEVAGASAVIVEPGSAKSLLAAMDSLYRDRRRLGELSQKAFDRVRTFCDPVAVSKQRVNFYQRMIENFRHRPPDFTSNRLASLPPEIAGALLPCISRVTSALLRIDTNIDSPGGRLEQICQKLTTDRGESARILLYGAGKHTARLLSESHRWERHGHKVVGLIDDHPRFVRMPQYLGLPVRSLAEAQKDAIAGNAMPAVVLSTDTYEQQFWEQTAPLREQGVRVFKLYGKQ